MALKAFPQELSSILRERITFNLRMEIDGKMTFIRIDESVWTAVLSRPAVSLGEIIHIRVRPLVEADQPPEYL